MKHKLSRILLAFLSVVIAGAGVFSYADAQTKKRSAPTKKQVVIKPQPKLKPAPIKKKPVPFKRKPLPARVEEPTIIIIPNAPLIAPPQSIAGTLTHDGVVAWTNIQRQQNGNLAHLKNNAQLDEIASLRLKDMFARQYFAHNNPDTNAGASDIAKDIGYQYILVGENIALGDFGTDEKLVQAWMDSPHHRENILKKGYDEIGVAVGRGLYKGDNTWIAVQIFGRPLSSCPAIDQNLKAKISAAHTAIEQKNTELSRLKAELDALEPNTKTELDAYNAKVRAYNTLVQQTNAHIAQVKEMIAEYNTQVKQFNACIAS